MIRVSSENRNKFLIVVCVISMVCNLAPAAIAQQKAVGSDRDANTQSEPKQMLRTGIDLCEPGVSLNSVQLADTIGLSPIIREIENLRPQVAADSGDAGPERLSRRQDLFEAVQKAMLLIQKTNLEIDFTIAEIQAEEMVYTEILDSYYDDRDRAITKTNAMGFVSNGALWALCEGLTIPTYKHPRMAIPSGITGILAGLIPTAASLYAMKQVSGKKKRSEAEPNMLAKLFDYPTNIDIEYPSSVWKFLNQVPANEPQKKTRKEQLIDGWVADANIHTFNDRQSKRQMDIITASVSHKDGLTIETLEVRSVMLQKLMGEIMKMKRMLLELNMAIQGEKRFVAYEHAGKKHIGSTEGGVTR